MRKEGLIGPALLTALAGLLAGYFWDALSRPVLLGERDLTVFFFPPIHLWVEALHQGTFPLWNPYTFSGQPLFASLQTAVLYPPNILLFLLPLPTAFNGTIMLHFFLGGWFIYLLSRELGGSRQAGVLSALAFSLGGFLLSLHTVLSSLQSAVWMPLVLFFLFRALAGSSRGYALLAGGAVLVQFLGGGIEVFMMTQALALLVIFFPALLLKGRSFPPLWERVKLSILSYGVFAGLGAVQILPFLEMVRESSRGLGLTYDQATAWSLSFRDLWYLILPDLFWRGMEFYYADQNWLRSIYMGLVPLVLIPFFLVKDRGRRWGIGLLLLASLILALGKNTPLYWPLYQVLPGLRFIRYPIKFFFLTNVLLCLAAGWGLDHLRDTLARRGGRPWVGLKRAALILAFAQVLSLLVLLVWSGPVFDFLKYFLAASPDRPWGSHIHNLVRFNVSALLVCLLLAFWADGKLRASWGAAALILLLTADLFLGNWGQYKRIDREAYLKSTPNLEIVKADPQPARVYTDPVVLRGLINARGEALKKADYLQERFYLDYPVIHRVFNASGFPVLIFKPYLDLISILETAPTPSATPVLPLMNVKYLLWSGPLPDSGFRLIRKMEPLALPEWGKVIKRAQPPPLRIIEPHLYEVGTVLPRAALIPKYRVVAEGRDMKGWLQDQRFNPRQTVLLAESPHFPSGKDPGPGRAEEARLTDYGLNHIALQAVCREPRVLLLSEVDYPGWQVRVNGRPEKIYRANHAFRAVALGPGTHEVRFEYRPRSFYWGLVITLVTLVGIMLGVILAFRGRKKERIRTAMARGTGQVAAEHPEG